MATTDSQNYKFTSMPQFSLTGTVSFGPQLSDIAALKTKIDGQDYYYIPQDYIQKGIVASGYAGKSPATYFSPQFLSSDFQNELKNKGTYIDIGSVANPNGGTYGDYLGALGRSTTGYFVPATKTVTSALENNQTAALGPNGQSGIVGVGNSPDGLAYLRTDTQGNDLSYTLPSGQSRVWSAPKQTSFQKFISDLGPLPTIATAIFAPQFLPLVSGATTAIQGGDLGDVLKSAGKSYVLGQVGQQAGVLGDQAAAAAQYGTDLGSAQTAMLAAQEAGLGTTADVLGNIAGSTAAGVVSGQPIEQALTGSLVNQGINTVANAAATPTSTQTPPDQLDTAFLQDMDQGIFQDTTLDTNFLQDMGQGIEPLNPVIPAENPFLAGMEEVTATEGAGVAGAGVPTGTYEGGANYLSGMEETAATEGAGVAGAENPTGTTVTVPTDTQEATKNLTPQQISQLLRIGAGLLGGGGALAAATRGLTGGTGGLIGPSMPTVQAPAPFTGTYSGMNPHDAAYFQQVQQNYNRLFPTSQVNVAAPLESWYQTKFVPDTTISNKLFGV